MALHLIESSIVIGGIPTAYIPYFTTMQRARTVTWRFHDLGPDRAIYRITPPDRVFFVMYIILASDFISLFYLDSFFICVPTYLDEPAVVQIPNEIRAQFETASAHRNS